MNTPRIHTPSRTQILRWFLGVFTLFVIATLAACGGGESSPSTTSPAASVAPTATPVGTANGAATSATIGTAGGSVSTADGKMTLTVPAGALGTDTLIGIQPITNTAHGRLGAGYRLTPDGQSFAQPVVLKFSYTDQDLAGSDPAILGAAFQTAAGYWQWLGNGEIPLYNYVCWFAISIILLFIFQHLQFSRQNKFAVNLLLIQAMFFLLLRTFL